MVCLRWLLTAGWVCALVVWSAEASAAPAPADAPEGAHAEHGEAGHGDAGHGNGAHGSADPLSVDPDLAIWTFIVFLVLLAVLWKFAWGPISAALEKRESTVAEHLAAAQRANEEAKRMLADYEKRLAAGAGEVSAMLAEARRDADVARLQILAEGKAQADAERARALADIETATSAALKQLAERSADLAVSLAGKIVKQKLTPGEQSQLVQEAVGRLSQKVSQN
jgi:F-type H+-transporting ATPase subunit b